MKSGLVCKPNQSRNQGPTVRAPAFAKDPSAALPIDHLNLCQPAPYHHPLAPPITAPTHSAPIPQIPRLAVPNQDLRNFPSPLRRSPSLQPRDFNFLVTGFHCQRKQEEGLEKKGDGRKGTTPLKTPKVEPPERGFFTDLTIATPQQPSYDSKPFIGYPEPLLSLPRPLNKSLKTQIPQASA